MFGGLIIECIFQFMSRWAGGGGLGAVYSDTNQHT